MAAKLNQHLTIRYPAEQEPLQFSSLEALSAWVEEETEAWQWLGEVARYGQPIQRLWHNTRNGFSQIRSLIDQYRKTEDNQTKAGLLNRLEGTLNQLASNGVRILSTDRRGQYLLDLAKEDPAGAAFTLAAFVEPQSIPANNVNGIRGLVYSEVFKHAVARKGIGAHRRALEETQKQWTQAVNERQAELNRLQTEWSQLLDTLNQDRSQWVDQFNLLLEESKANLEAIERTYDEKLAVQAPVQYWKDKSSEHGKRVNQLTLAFAGWGLVTGGILWFELDKWLIPKLFQSPAPASEYWAVVILVASATLLIWPLRILARLLLSNIHLRADADERVTMANTYLSLLRSESGLTEEDRKLILDALFRPARTGIITDDAMPPSVYSAITRAVTGDRGRG